MLFEMVTTGSMLGVLGASYYYRNNYNKDSDKIIKIAENCGLTKKGEGLRLYRRNYNRQYKYTDYIYKIPLGLELKDFNDKHGKFADGLNNRSVRRIVLKDFKGLTLRGNVLKQIHDILNNRVPLNKAVEFEYDGMLLVRVYDEGLGTDYGITTDIMKGVDSWHAPLGLTLKGQLVHDFETGPHILLGGATDMGKSTILNVIITTLLHNHADDVEFTLIDLKGGLEFGVYENCKQVKHFATNVEEAHEALTNVQLEMSRTFEQLRRTGKKNVKRAGIKKRHFVIIDESAELASEGEADKEVKKLKVACEGLIKDIARRGRASGVRLLYCTQYPTTETVSSQVKRNLITRICLPVDTATASNVVLDESGAEALPLIQGRAIYKRNRKQVMQAYNVSDKVVEGVVKVNIRARGEQREKPNAHGIKTQATGREYTTKFEAV